MTTKPKARKFRIRRTVSGNGHAAGPGPETGVEDELQQTPETTPQPPVDDTQHAPVHEGEVSSTREVSVSQDIDDIR